MKSEIHSWQAKPWFVAVLGIFTTVFVFLYLNKPKLFFYYLMIGIIFGLAVIFLNINGAILWIIPFICAIQGYKTANSTKITQRQWYSKFWWILWLPTISLLIVISLYLFELFVVASVSMLPTYQPKDILIVKKFNFELERGKVYVFHHPQTNNTYVKRLIGLEHDTLNFIGDEVSINNKKVGRSLIFAQSDSKIYQETLDNISYSVEYIDYGTFYNDTKITVADGNYFFLGDNRNNSADSRQWGSVPGENIIGEVIYKIESLIGKSVYYTK